MLITARRAAALGARIIKDWLGKHVDITMKAPADQVTQVDLQVEEEVVRFINSRHPEHFVLAEEGHGDYALLKQPGALVWVIDPLDGTSNFIHGWPMAAISVALVQDGQPLLGVIRHVFNDEEFYASKGGGAWLGERQLRVSPTKALARALGGFAFPFRQRALQPAFMELFNNIFNEIEDVRRGGSAALDLAYVAAGRLDFYFETGLKPWDMAAGILLVQEAGGLVSDFSGTGHFLLGGDILAANSHLHAGLLAHTQPWAKRHM